MSYDIFISYRRTDQALAGALVAALEARKVEVWWDQNIEGGEDWRDAIVEGLTNSRAMVILFSAACNSSKQLRKELAIADTLEKEVIPVLIEDTQPKGHFLYELAVLNWLQIHPNPETKIEGLADRLVRELDLEAPAATPAFQPTPIDETGADAEAPAPIREAPAPASARPAEAPPIEARAVEKVVKAAQAKERSAKDLRDFLPFKWYELLIAGVAGLLAALGSLDPTAGMDYPLLEVPLFMLLILLLIALVVFPFRYYFRRRRVWRAVRSYFLSTMTIAVVCGFLYGIHPTYYEPEAGLAGSMAIMMSGTLIMVAALSTVAFSIYGLLHFQRTLRSFNRNVEAI